MELKDAITKIKEKLTSLDGLSNRVEINKYRICEIIEKDLTIISSKIEKERKKWD